MAMESTCDPLKGDFVRLSLRISSPAKNSEHRRDQLDEQETLILLLAALCHDPGKPATTEFRDGRWRALSMHRSLLILHFRRRNQFDRIFES